MAKFFRDNCVFPASGWCCMFQLWAGKTHSLFWSPANELPELNCLLEKPHTRGKPGTKCIQVESNFKNHHQICPDSPLWHTQPTAVKTGHKHSLHYRSDQVLGMAPSPFFSFFRFPTLSLVRLYNSLTEPFVLLLTQKSQWGFLFFCFSSICTKTALLLLSKSRSLLWAAAFANRTWTWRMKEKTELSCLLGVNWTYS